MTGEGTSTCFKKSRVVFVWTKILATFTSLFPSAWNTCTKVVAIFPSCSNCVVFFKTSLWKQQYYAILLEIIAGWFGILGPKWSRCQCQLDSSLAKWSLQTNDWEIFRVSYFCIVPGLYRMCYILWIRLFF